MSEATKTIKQLDAEAEQMLLSAKAVLDDRENRTPEDVEGAEKSLDDALKIVERLEKVRGENATKALLTINKIENSRAALHQPASPYVPVGTDGVGTDARGNVHAIKSLGDQFISDPLLKQWLAQVAPGGRVPDKLGADSPGVPMKALLYAAGATTGTPFMWSDQRREMVLPAPLQPLFLRDMITVLPTDDSVIEYIRITGYTNAAAPVAEATATAGTSGLKPESGMATEKVTDRVRTIAHWIPATTKILRFAPGLRTFVDQFLRYGVNRALEAQMIDGDGAGENLLGILRTPNLSTQAYVAAAAPAQPLLVTTRMARTKVMTQGFAEPTAYVFHPEDWQTIDLLTTTQGQFYFGGPLAEGTRRLWGVPVVETMGMPQGRSLVGDFRTCVLWDVDQAVVRVGTAGDDFIRNMIRILAELIAGFGVLNPKALVDTDLTAA